MKQKLQNAGISASALFCSVALCVLFFSCTRAGIPMEERTLARLNGQDLAARDFILSLSVLTAEQDDVSRKNTKLSDQLKSRAFNETLVTALLRQEAAKRNIRVAREEVEGRLGNWKDSYPPGGFEEMLAKNHSTEESLRRRIEDQFLVEKLTDSIFAEELLVSDEELKRHYSEREKTLLKPERVHVFQIVVPLREEAERIRSELTAGQISFESAARRHSLSPDASKGGDLGFFAKGEKIAAFDQAFSLPVNVLSKPIESRYGWHLLKVVEKEPSRKLSFNEAKEQLVKTLRRSKQARAYREWLTKMLKDAEIYRNESLYASLP